MWLLRGGDVLAALENCEAEVLAAVRQAYLAHARGDSALPHSTFLQFTADSRERIIALPAYLGDGFRLAGVKWIASFPGNLERGLERASAVMILNSTETGCPEVIVEGSVLSAKRTAASACLAAEALHDLSSARGLGLIGCGLVNFETAKFLLRRAPAIERIAIFDVFGPYAQRFAWILGTMFPGRSIVVAESAIEVLAGADLVSIATTAGTPYLNDLSACSSGMTILHLSLRDIAPESIVLCDNVVDDIDHVCRAQTSLHRAEQSVGDRDFIRCTLGDVLAGRAPARSPVGRPVAFSPFGLGILDLVVASVAVERARHQGRAQAIEDFFPPPWHARLSTPARPHV